MNDEARYKLVNYDTILAPDREYMERYFGHCEVINAFQTRQYFLFTPDYFPMQIFELIDNQLFIMFVVQIRFNLNKSFQNFS